MQKDQWMPKEDMFELIPDEGSQVLEMTPSKPAEKADISEELILTPSLPEERIGNDDLILESGDIIKLEEITFDGEEAAEKRIAEAMAAYDQAMDKAAGFE